MGRNDGTTRPGLLRQQRAGVLTNRFDMSLTARVDHFGRLAHFGSVGNDRLSSNDRLSLRTWMRYPTSIVNPVT